MIINGHELTERELRQAYVEYQRMCDIEDLQDKIEEMIADEDIPAMSEAEIRELAERLAPNYRRALDNNDSIRECEILAAQYSIEEELEDDSRETD